MVKLTNLFCTFFNTNNIVYYEFTKPKRGCWTSEKNLNNFIIIEEEVFNNLTNIIEEEINEKRLL